MIHFKATTSPAVLKVHSILDAKIKKIEYKTQCKFQDCICDRKLTAGSFGKSPATSLTENFELMLRQIDEQRVALQQLQTIRCWLRKENLKKVAELLQNDKYQAHSESELESMLKKGTLELMRLRQTS